MTTILYDYHINERATDKRILHKTYANLEAFEQVVHADFLKLSKPEQAAAQSEFNELLEMIQPKGWKSVMSEMEVGEHNEIPFGFESATHFYTVDIILHRETEEEAETGTGILYDYYVTDIDDSKNVYERYLFDNDWNFRAFILDKFEEVSSEDKAAANDDFAKMYKNIETDYWKDAIKKIRKTLDLLEVSTIHFSFKEQDVVHHLDVLVRGDEVIRCV